MAESLAVDGDLRFDDHDRGRAAAGSLGESPTVILQRADDALYYSKPAIYPLIATPLFLVAGRAGFWITNSLLLVLTAGFAWRSLRSGQLPSKHWWLATYLGCSAVLVYIAWSMSDVLQFALALLGTVAAVELCRRRVSGWQSALSASALVAGICLGLLSATRPPQALLAAGVILMILWAGKVRRALVVGMLVAATWGASTLVNDTLVHSGSPYTAVRTSFNALTGYPRAANDDLAESRLDVRLAAHRYQWKLDGRLAWSALYSLIGRHSGIAVYFPLSLVLLFLAFRNGGPQAALAVGVLALWLFYLFYRPGNYFGGSAAVGNRYFLPSYGVLFGVLAWADGHFLRQCGKKPWLWIFTWSLAAVVGASALASTRQMGFLDNTSQSHAAAGLFRFLPYESTLTETEGQRARFWGRDYLRFVDKRTQVHEGEWVVDSSVAGATEFFVASHRQAEGFRFEAKGAPGTLVTIESWLGGPSTSVELVTPQPTSVVVPRWSPWVRHSMPFDAATVFSIYRFRAKIETPRPEGKVRLRYLGVVPTAANKHPTRDDQAGH